MESRWIIKREDSKLYAFFIAILPCVMMYKVPIVDKGFATVIVLVCSILLLLNFHQVDLYNIRMIIPCIIYVIYVVYKSAGNWIEIILQISTLIHLYAICSGMLNVTAIKKYIINISLFAAVCVLVQSIVHLLLNIHIPMIANSLCLDEMKRYTYRILTGMNEGIYRPSAIFLEPAHMAQYLMLGLTMCLLDNHIKIIKALIISFGMLLTTSGMGIVILVCIWGWFYFARVISSKRNKVKILMGGAIAILIVLVIAISIPGFQRILARIFGTFGKESSDYNAIHGRLFWWETYFSNFKGSDLLFGKGSAAIPDDYFTGFMEILYAYGIVGISLYYNMIICLLCKSNNTFSSCIIILTGGLMVFANLTGFIQTILYLGLIIAFIKENVSELKINDEHVMYAKNKKCCYIR